MTMMMLMVFPFTQHERGLWWFLNVLQCRASSANNNRLITRLWISFPAANSYNYGRGEVCQKRRQFVEWMEFSLAWNWKTLSRQRCDGCGEEEKVKQRLWWISLSTLLKRPDVVVSFVLLCQSQIAQLIPTMEERSTRWMDANPIDESSADSSIASLSAAESESLPGRQQLSCESSVVRESEEEN